MGPDDRTRAALNRRQFVQAAGLASSAIFAQQVLAGGQVLTPDLQVPSSFNEAPMIAELGDFPPVEERLPTNPKVVEPHEEIGEYGGQLRLTYQGPAQGTGLIPRTNGYEFLMRWKPDAINFALDELEPNVAESVEIEDDGATYVFRLREGMRWSDGEPYTADDIMFWYEDFLMNEEITPAVAAFLQAGDEPVVVERVDDLTVRFSFVEPNGLFLIYLATPDGQYVTGLPRHYIEQFHIDYNPDAIQLAEDANLEDWTDLILDRVDANENIERPTLNAWLPDASVGETTQQLIATRNPYYFKVDTEGNQLPYIDEVAYRVVLDREVQLLNALNGELDMLPTAATSVRDQALFFDGQEEGDFRMVETIPAIMNTLIITVNMTHQDQELREIFANKDFRIGLSHAINRQEIIDAVFVSQGEPYQAAPRPESDRYYHEQLATQYTEFDVDLANEHLDMVLPDRDDDGYRLGPDGERFFFTVEGAMDYDIVWPDMLEMIRLYWEEVGIQADMSSIERSLYVERTESNQQDATFWAGGGGLDVALGTYWYFPSTAGATYAAPWAAWFINPEGDLAIEPPEEVQRQMELYGQLSATEDADEQAALMTEILDISAEQFYSIGTVLTPPGFTIVANRLHNVPEPLLDAWRYPSPGPTNTEQYFIREA